MSKISKTELIKLQKSLKTDAAIGKKFKITRQAVHQLRQKYGIPVILGKNDERDAKILALHKKGVDAVEIAKKMKLSVSQTYRIARTFGQKKKRK
jgi:Mor family transcriptional regulator